MDTKTQAMLNAMAAQRNQALDMVVALQAEIAERDEKIKSLETPATETPQV